MPEPAPYADRLKKGLHYIEQQNSAGCDEEAIEPLHRSLERTLARQVPGNTLPASPFRFQVTGGKALLFQGNEALPLEPARLSQLLNTIQVELRAGEFLELDGGLVAWLLRSEINLTDTNLRQADVSLRGMKTGRERDHAAAQSAESTKVRLRSRMTQLVSALQLAQRDAAADSVAPAASAAPDVPEKAEESQLPPKKPNPALTSAMMDTPPPPEVLAKALRKMLAAIEGSGFKAAIVGEIAHQAWGSKQAAKRVELLVSSSAAQRDTLMGAARGEGLQQAPGGAPLQLQFVDAKAGATAAVKITEAATPFQKQVLTRAQPGAVVQVQVRVATCEDLILMRAGSDDPADRDSVIELLRGTAGRIDAPYLKKEAEAAGVFDQLKIAWQQAKQQG